MPFADVSHHNAIDVAAYFRSGRNTLAMKATEGTTFTDPTFVARWKAAAGNRRIAYHFLRNSFAGDIQFNHFWAVVKSAGWNPHTDILALDTEDPDDPKDALVCSRTFVNAAVKAGFPSGLIYTYYDYAKVHGITSASFPAGWRKLWFANYTSKSDSELLLPPGWTTAQFVARQYSSTAKVPGVTGDCDDSRTLIDWLGTVPAATTTGGTVTTPVNVWDETIKVPSDRQADYVHSAYPAGTILLDIDQYIRYLYKEAAAAVSALQTCASLLQGLVTMAAEAQAAQSAPTAAAAPGATEAPVPAAEAPTDSSATLTDAAAEAAPESSSV